MRVHLGLGLQHSLAFRPKCLLLDQGPRRLVGTESGTWVKRVNKVVTQKLVSRAKTLAHASAPPKTRSDGVMPSLTSRLMAVPQIQQPQELFNSAMKPVRKLKPRTDLRYDQEVASNLAARTMDTLIKEITARFKTFISGFPRFERLHPFEKSVLDLAVGEGNYKRILGNADKLRRKAMKVGKEYASKAKAAKTPAQASVCAEEGTQALHQVLTVHGKGTLWELQHLARQMRQVPQIDLCVPTIALIGAPNVGKSSLVQVLSSGTPEICNYPFTTRSIKMGHFYVNNIRHQVTDTPGLLYRPDEERNAMEMLTVATLEHLPTAALFVLDLTEGCGCSVQDQWHIRRELLQRFPSKLWIDVITKIDLLEEEVDEAKAMGQGAPPDFQAQPASAEQAVQWLPHAVKVSSVTEQGLDELKQAVLDLMAEENWAAQADAMIARDSDTLNQPETE
eukprot:jgi/Ulvmu1/8058/UM004_0295.1